MTADVSGPVVEGYDALYAAIAGSPTFSAIWRREAIGLDYPDDFAHISFLTFAELQRMGRELRLEDRATLVDLACGGAGPSLWLAREAGARLVGVDPSSAGLAEATSRARRVGLEDSSEFVQGSFLRTVLPMGSADGLMSVDALQYSPDQRTTFVEAARVLRPGGRFVFTAFELLPDRLEGLEMLWPDPTDDYRPFLDAAGFEIDTYEEAGGWRERVRRTYEALTAEEDALIQEMGEVAATGLAFEASVTLERDPYLRRVFVVAVNG